MGGKQDAVMADARAFMKSRVILTAAELDFFTRLSDSPCTAEDLAAEKGLDARATTRLLDCLITLELLEKDSGLYKTTENGAFYSSRHPETVLPMVQHLNRLWTTWGDLTEITRRGSVPERKPGLSISMNVNEESWKSFIGAMHVAGRELSLMIAQDYDLSRFKRLLDIGGASGTYTIAFLRKNPQMRAVIFDLENVIPMARERLAKESILDRVELVAGDFYTEELPKGCDLALLSAIIHQNSPEENRDLYAKIHRALDPGGTILIRDHVMDETRTQPPAGAMFALNMLVNTRGGDTYTFREIKDDLEKSGFTDVKQVRSGQAMDCLVEAKK